MAITPEPEDDLPPEFDLSQLKGGVRGKHYERYQASPPRFLRLDPDFAAAYPTEASVNAALRKLAAEHRPQA